MKSRYNQGLVSGKKLSTTTFGMVISCCLLEKEIPQKISSLRFIILLSLVFLCFNIKAQVPNFLGSSSTGIKYIAWGSDWWMPNTSRDKRYAESMVELTWTDALASPAYLNAALSYSQVAGTVTIDIYIATSLQMIMTLDNPYNHVMWYNGDSANLGNYVGQVVADNAGTLASFDISSWISANPSNYYTILFDQNNDNNDAIVNYAWLGPYQSITKIAEPSGNFEESDLSLENYPNPFNSSTTLNYSLKESESVSIKVYNSNGQLTKVLIENEVQNQGQHKTKWDCLDYSGNCVNNGIYLIRLETPSQVLQKKVIFVR